MAASVPAGTQRDNGYDVTDFYGVDEKHGTLGAARQRRDPESLLNWTERLLRMRKECPEIGWGSCTVMNTRNKAVLALRHEWRGNSMVVVHNFGEEPTSVNLDVGEDTLVSLLSDDHHKSKSGVHTVPLGGYEFRWFRVGGLAYVLDRQR